MKIIDWVKTIKKFESDANKENLLELIQNDFNTIRDYLCDGEPVIIRVAQGFRIEIHFIYEFGQLDIRKISKDFNSIYEFNQLTQQTFELAEQIRELLKDDNAALAGFNEYIKQKTQHPLFNINIIRDNKISKSISGIPYILVEAYIRGFIEGVGNKKSS